MNAIEKAEPGLSAASDGGSSGAGASLSPTPTEVASWLLDGRYLTVDGAAAVTTWSDEAADTFGWTRRDVVGCDFAQTLIDAPDRGAQADSLRALLDGQRDARLGGEVGALTADGRRLRVELVAVPIETGVGYEFNALLQEVSTQSRTERPLAQLRERHDRIVTLIEAALAGRHASGEGSAQLPRLAGALIVFDVRGTEQGPIDNVVPIVDASGDERRHLDELRRDAARASTLRWQLDDARREARQARAEADAARREASDQRAALADATRHAQESEELLAGARAEADRMLRELAERERQLDELHRHVERMNAVFDRAAVGALLTTPDGEILEVNRTLCDMLGRSRTALVDGDPAALVHPDEAEARRGVARRLLLGEQAVSRGYRRYVHADGYTLPMRECISLVRDRDGEPLVFLVQLDEAAGADRSATDVASAEPALETAGDARVRRAVEEERFALHCQPVTDLLTGAIAQYELLLRIVGDDGRIVLPREFLAAARRAGLASSIDAWVISRAVSLLAEDATRELRLEVNLSPEAIHDPRIVDAVEQELAATSVDPARLILGLTSDAALEDLDGARVLATRLRQLGCRFGLDDFHSTAGSLRILRGLPLDYLKLDGDLVGSLAESRTSQLIVRAIADVARATGTETIAVFVSAQEMLPLLRQQGVRYAQGYAVGRPRAIEEVWRAEQRVLPPAPE